MGGVLALGVLALGSGKGRLVEKAVGVNHAVVNAAPRDPLESKLGFGGEIAPTIVAEMVVGGYGQRVDACVDES